MLRLELLDLNKVLILSPYLHTGTLHMVSERYCWPALFHFNFPLVAFSHLPFSLEHACRFSKMF